MSSPWATYKGGDDDDRDQKVTRLPLRITPVRLPHGKQIPPRPWLYGTHLMRGMMSLLVSPGGVGKTQLAMATALCLATGQPLLGQRVHKRVRSWIFNLEDPLVEMERRLEALLIHHDIHDLDVRDWMFMDSGRDRKLCMAMVDPDGNRIVFPDKDAVIAVARANDIGFIGVDPFIKSHELDENSNPHMDAAASAWAEVAHEVNCASLIVHHVRKGAVVDIDSARGGSALASASRSALLLSPMQPEEAELMGILKGERWRHIRLDDGKANMAPKAENADWYIMHPVKLGNETEDYPNGDTVTALAKWEPPPVFRDIPSALCNIILDRIAAGYAPGVLYRPNQRGGASPRWVGNVLVNEGISEGQAKRVVDTWLRTGLLLETKYTDEQRRERTGVTVDDSKRPTC